MNAFDHDLLLALNHLAGRSRLLDAAVTELANSHLAKGVPVASVLLAFWFARASEREVTRRREVIVATFAAAGVAVALGRLLAHALPFRLRPIHDAVLGLVPPYGGAERTLSDWSAFPSDHAMLFGAMATGIAFLSRRAGLAAHAYAAILVFLPRVYLAWHHPTDILAGLALGVALTAVANVEAVRSAIARPPLALLAYRPALFYAAAFVVVMQVATLFADVREVLRGPLLAELRGRSAAFELAAPRTAVATGVCDGPRPARATGRAEAVLIAPAEE
jgi:membrane-associated phospholipid phosphatase